MKVLLMLIILVGSLSGQNLKSILLHQRDSGGWPKNKDYEAKMDREKLRQEKGAERFYFRQWGDNFGDADSGKGISKEWREEVS
jgi:protein gp37